MEELYIFYNLTWKSLLPCGPTTFTLLASCFSPVQPVALLKKSPSISTRTASSKLHLRRKTPCPSTLILSSVSPPLPLPSTSKSRRKESSMSSKLRLIFRPVENYSEESSIKEVSMNNSNPRRRSERETSPQSIWQKSWKLARITPSKHFPRKLHTVRIKEKSVLSSRLTS